MPTLLVGDSFASFAQQIAPFLEAHPQPGQLVVPVVLPPTINEHQNAPANLRNANRQSGLVLILLPGLNPAHTKQLLNMITGNFNQDQWSRIKNIAKPTYKARFDGRNHDAPPLPRVISVQTSMAVRTPLGSYLEHLSPKGGPMVLGLLAMGYDTQRWQENINKIVQGEECKMEREEAAPKLETTEGQGTQEQGFGLEVPKTSLLFPKGIKAQINRARAAGATYIIVTYTPNRGRHNIQPLCKLLFNQEQIEQISIGENTMIGPGLLSGMFGRFASGELKEPRVLRQADAKARNEAQGYTKGLNKLAAKVLELRKQRALQAGAPIAAFVPMAKPAPGAGS
jgi:hypothetical protein